MTEHELQSAVIECARLLGWRVAHFRPAETTKGWRTPVEADGAGFPDLCMVNPRQRRILFVELKAENGRLRPQQAQWREALLLAAGDRVAVEVWRPEDWTNGHIERVLRGRVREGLLVPAD